MMKIISIKIYTIVLIIVLFTGSASAQSGGSYKPIQTGPRLTADVLFQGESSLIVKDALGIDSLTLRPNKNATDFGLGMFMQINVMDYLFLRPEAIVHISNRHMELEPTIGIGSTENLTHRLYSFSLPIQLGYRVEGVSLQAGIVWHNQLRTDLLKVEKENFNYQFGNGYTSFTVGLGYQSNWILLDFYYEKALGNSEDLLTVSNREYTLKYKPQHLSLRLGFIISGRN